MSIIDLLNAREHLELYGRIKLLKYSDLYNEIDELIENLNLSMNGDILAGNYSGGNKRKLMVAVSMISKPVVLYLDEPSTGMDPESKRFMWSAIKKYKKNSAIILTTHSMDEAESLADNLIIMKSGHFVTNGNINYIKNKYSSGIYIDIMLKNRNIDTLKE